MGDRTAATCGSRCRDQELRVHGRAARLRRRRGHLSASVRRWSSRRSDKFAALPWRPRRRQPLQPRRADEPPPELIIQDELHLISGPLGTLAGLYETAVDLLCTEEGAPPKVIASTATIRRATHRSRRCSPARCASSRRPASTPGDSLLRGRGAARPEGDAPLRRADGAGRQPRDADDPRLRLAAQCGASTAKARRRLVTRTGRWSATSTACACSAAPGCRSTTTSATGSSSLAARRRRPDARHATTDRADQPRVDSGEIPRSPQADGDRAPRRETRSTSSSRRT